MLQKSRYVYMRQRVEVVPPSALVSCIFSFVSATAMPSLPHEAHTHTHTSVYEGTDVILTYYAKQAALWLAEDGLI